MDKGRLYFTSGMPRCGKSTYCEEWVKQAPKRVIVCSDDIRLALHGHRYEPLAETIVFGIKHIMIRSLLSRGFDVIVDGTHSTEISIQRILEIDQNAICIMFDTSKEECIKRALATGQNDLIPAIERIYDNLERNGYYDGEWQYFLMSVNDKVKARGLY